MLIQLSKIWLWCSKTKRNWYNTKYKRKRKEVYCDFPSQRVERHIINLIHATAMQTPEMSVVVQ